MFKMKTRPTACRLHRRAPPYHLLVMQMKIYGEYNWKAFITTVCYWLEALFIILLLRGPHIVISVMFPTFGLYSFYRKSIKKLYHWNIELSCLFYALLSHLFGWIFRLCHTIHNNSVYAKQSNCDEKIIKKIRI